MRHDHIKVTTQEGRNNTTRKNRKITKIKKFNVKWVNMTILGPSFFKKKGRKEMIAQIHAS